MSSLLYLWVGSKEGECNHIPHYENQSYGRKKLSALYFNNTLPLIPPPHTHTRKPSLLLTPGIQLCVTKPVLLESECSMRQGHMGSLPTSSLPSSPSLEYTLPLPARQHKAQGSRVMLLDRLAVALVRRRRGGGGQHYAKYEIIKYAKYEIIK